jgi:type IV secretion system protein VirB11
MNHLLAHAAASIGLTPYLDDPAIREIRGTSQGRCFVIHSTNGKQRMPDIPLPALDSFLSLIASHYGCEWKESSPRMSVGSPELGFRIQASRPPVSPGPNMVLRKHPAQAFTLSQFVTDDILTPAQKGTLEHLLDTRQTIVIAGAMGSGKTSLLNGCLGYISDTKERIIVVEDTQEVVCHAEEVEFFCTVASQGLTYYQLCLDAFRNSPDTIVLGECRGGEVLEALKCINVGHRGLMTLHAKSAEKTLTRLEQLVQEASKTSQQPLIAEAVNVVVHMEHHYPLFRCTDIIAVDGWSKKGGYETHSMISEAKIG